MRSWQLTQNEWIHTVPIEQVVEDIIYLELVDKAKIDKLKKAKTTTQIYKALGGFISNKYHEEFVRGAVKKGLKVPKKVLEEYGIQ